MNGPASELLVAFGGIAAFAFVIWITVMIWRGQKAQIRRWAETAGLRVVSIRFCWLWKGPYTLWSTDSQRVYRCESIDRRDRTLRAYVKCGHWFWGAARDDLDVWWDD